VDKLHGRRLDRRAPHRDAEDTVYRGMTHYTRPESTI
jgi:hypothetical protein